MASAISHFVMGATLALPFTALPSVEKSVRPIGLMFAAGLAAVGPDLDTVFFGVIPYSHFFGHRGFFHSPLFAALFAVTLSGFLLLVLRNMEFRGSTAVCAAFFLAIASHGVLDAMTNAGLGVMLLYPYSAERYFLPWRPLHAPLIKLNNLSYNQLRTMFNSELPLLLGCAVTAVMVKIILFRRKLGLRKNRSLPNSPP